MLVSLVLTACTSDNPAYGLDEGGSSTSAGGSSTSAGGSHAGDELGSDDDAGSADGSGSPPSCDAPAPTDATCDGIDDDCDGSIDEDYAPITSCGIGHCNATNTPSSCIQGMESACIPGEPIDELPDDDVDQDCDGMDAVSGPPIDSFWDDFEDGSVDPRWAEPACTGDCSIAEQSGVMHFAMPAGQACSCTLSTADVYSLVDEDVLLDVPAITYFFEPLRFSMALVTEQGDVIEYGFDGSGDAFFAEIEDDGALVFAQKSEYPPRPRFWRIREQGGQLYFESSPDGASWGVEMQTETPFFVGAVRFRFGAEISAPMPNSVGISVPNYNTLP